MIQKIKQFLGQKEPEGGDVDVLGGDAFSPPSLASSIRHLEATSKALKRTYLVLALIEMLILVKAGVTIVNATLGPDAGWVDWAYGAVLGSIPAVVFILVGHVFPALVIPAHIPAYLKARHHTPDPDPGPGVEAGGGGRRWWDRLRNAWGWILAAEIAVGLVALVGAGAFVLGNMIESAEFYGFNEPVFGIPRAYFLPAIFEIALLFTLGADVLVGRKLEGFRDDAGRFQNDERHHYLEVRRGEAEALREVTANELDLQRTRDEAAENRRVFQRRTALAAAKDAETLDVLVAEAKQLAQLEGEKRAVEAQDELNTLRDGIAARQELNELRRELRAEVLGDFVALERKRLKVLKRQAEKGEISADVLLDAVGLPTGTPPPNNTSGGSSAVVPVGTLDQAAAEVGAGGVTTTPKAPTTPAATTASTAAPAAEATSLMFTSNDHHNGHVNGRHDGRRNGTGGGR